MRVLPRWELAERVDEANRVLPVPDRWPPDLGCKVDRVMYDSPNLYQEALPCHQKWVSSVLRD
jgi:hypothetical protein